MHDIKWIREHEEEFDRGLARRGLPPEAGKLIALDERRRAAIQKAEAALARRNAASKEIGAAKKSNEEAAAQALMAEVARLKAEIPALEAEEKQLSKQLDEALAQIPNLPLDEVPDGKDESANVEHHHFGAKRNYGIRAPAAFRSRRGARSDGLRDRREAFGRAFCRAQERPGTAGTGARAVHARSAYDRARLHRGQPTAVGARRDDVRHGAIAKVRRRSVFCDPNDCPRGTTTRCAQICPVGRSGGVSARETRFGSHSSIERSSGHP